MQYKIGLIGKDKQLMSKRWMTYTINNQLLDNLDHQVYLLELAVVITKTLNIHCSHIDIVLSWTVCHIEQWNILLVERKLSFESISIWLYIQIGIIQNKQHCNIAYYIWDVRRINITYLYCVNKQINIDKVCNIR